ncbi:Dimethlysulfonioproprionate lyase DddP [compost metagenome]
MVYHATCVDLDDIRAWRIGRVRRELASRNYAGILLFDPVNIRYALDAKNMQVWSMHNRVRYAYVSADGSAVLFEFPGCEHLVAGNPFVSEVRVAKSSTYLTSASDVERDTRAWAEEIADLVSRNDARIAMDVCEPHMMFALQSRGIKVENGAEVMECARWIKNESEIAAMQEAIYVCEVAIKRMRAHFEPGMTENALISVLHQANIELGGEWIESRLLTSGRKTKPWFQEASDKMIERGEFVSFDTDLIGPNGYCADISRAWLCGGGKGTPEQREIYQVAYEQLQHNIDLIKPGKTLRDVSLSAYQLPASCDRTFYSMVAHGVGLCDESPLIRHPWDLRTTVRDDVEIAPGMVLCVESLVALNDGYESVKLEEQLLVTDRGVRLLSSSPFEKTLLE